MARALTALLGLFILIAQSAHVGFVGGALALSWSLHVAVLLVCLLPALDRRARMIGLALIGLAVWPWFRPLTAPTATLATQPTLTLLSANTFHDNPKIEEAARVIESSGADVVALIEPDVRIFDMLPSYRRVVAFPSGDKFGIAFMARPALRFTRTAMMAGVAPLLTADLSHEGRTLRLVAIHALAPTNFEQQRIRYGQVDQLMGLVRSSTVPVVLFGDLNMVLGSPLFRRILADDKLRRPAGISPGTWPRQLGFVGLPIDQILVSPSVEATTPEALFLPGSDHRALLVKIR